MFQTKSVTSIKSAASYKLPKSSRLFEKKRIDLLYSKGKNLNHFPLRIKYLESGEGDGSVRVLFVVPKRLVKTAILRNRIRRQMRTSYRLKQHLIEKGPDSKLSLLLAIHFLGNREQDYSVIQSSLETLLLKLNKKLGSKA